MRGDPNFFVDILAHQLAHELQEQEAYAHEHGYTIKDLVTASGWKIFHVYQTGSPSSRCHCAIREDAVRIAFALAKTFPKTEGAP